MQWLEVVACLGPLWELAFQLQSLMETTTDTRRAGRPREAQVFDMLLFEVLAWALRSYEAVQKNLADPVVWEQMRATVAMAWPDDPDRRLGARPPTRSQHYRFRKKWLSDHFLEVMRNRIDEAAAEAALSMGMLKPGVGSLTDPDPHSFVTGDGCWLPALTKLTRKDATDPYTGEIVGRYDPDALAYHPHEDDFAAPRAQGASIGDVAGTQPVASGAHRVDDPPEVRLQPRDEPQRRDHRRRRAPGPPKESSLAALGATRNGLRHGPEHGGL